MRRLAITIAAAALAGPALAQTAPRAPSPAPSGVTVEREPGSTGSVGGTSIAPGATGASTINNDSAAAGNANQPERRIPQGSGGGSSGGAQ